MTLLRDIGEHSFIREVISNYLDEEKLVDINYLPNTDLGVKIDGFKLSYTFDYMNFYDLGWKAVTATSSDMISGGISPRYFLTSVGLKKELELDSAIKLLEGIKDAVRYYNGLLIGGDTNDSAEGWIDVVGIGEIMCRIPYVLAPGDIIILTNPIFYAALGFVLISRNIKPPMKVLSKLKHPIINSSLVNVIKDNCKSITYTTDISDGLLISLSNILHINKNFGIKLNKMPIIPDVQEMMKEYNISVAELLKYSGEDFESIIVTKPTKVKELMNELYDYGFEPDIIGEITDSNPGKILLKGENIVIHGWDNFKGWF
ncbi:MAG: thiamine-monophosphate kinase [Sulfolobus sp.]|nr:thiamine-monophosphate kinase [Sulfolobus sp.]